jgi:hypothetical protein
MAEGEGLQFERAEFENAPAQAQCGECRRALIGFYYDVSGQTICEACKYTIEARLSGGSAAGRFARATGAGVVAAALGAAVYYAISALTGYEFGLIAIVVGFAVGSAVRWGSEGRGGKSYQALAMMLTYLAIVTTYIPPIIEGFREAAADESEIAESASSEADEASTTPVSAPAPPETSEVAAEAQPLGAAGTFLALLFVLAIACAAPFLGGVENIIGIVIIGIGLYEAWKLNRRSTVAITGPHALTGLPVEAASA